MKKILKMEKELLEKLRKERDEWRNGRPQNPATVTGVKSQRRAFKVERRTHYNLPLFEK